MTATTGLEAWTVRALTDALNAPEEFVERALDQNVADGRAVRLSQGEFTFYIPGQLRDVLTALGAEPVHGARIREVRESEVRRKVGLSARERRARRRASEVNGDGHEEGS